MKITHIDPSPFLQPEQDARYYLQLPMDKWVICITVPLDNTLCTEYFSVLMKKLFDVLADIHLIVLFDLDDATLQEKFENKLKSLGKQSNITIIKQTRYLADALKASDVFISPTFVYENHDNRILKAMACGLPVITLENEHTSEMIIDEKTGYLIDFNNIDNLIEKLSTLKSNQELANSLGKMAQKRILENFSI
ncbi:glycosyltransferase family 4 protein [Belliella sp. DSM 111904]|uniref:Glycosyltransferase family 4 protein n=1 Tax=Belliella filtrata TaxID=2923435 RepID=A0ABS9UVH2_9BACT|nr:glycosyltransferase family 4 protein [Belliella filtrata]MCH7407955.1 glycosyltransferase family 4 protein [Belliella filtrata]